MTLTRCLEDGAILDIRDHYDMGFLTCVGVHNRPTWPLKQFDQSGLVLKLFSAFFLCINEPTSTIS